MPYTPPWLVPPDFLGAMRGGAEAGIAASRTAQAAQEAAQRTRLGYAQLAQEASSDMARIAANREAQAIAAAESLRGHGLRELALAQDQRNRVTDDERMAAALGLQERKQLFDERQASLPGQDKVFHVGDSLISLDQAGKPTELFKGGQSRLSQLDNMQLGAAITAKRQAQMNLADLTKSALGKDKYEKIISDADAVIARFAPGVTAQPTLEAPGQLSSPGAPETLEVRRRTSDGRTAIFDAATKAFIRYAD